MKRQVSIVKWVSFLAVIALVLGGLAGCTGSRGSVVDHARDNRNDEAAVLAADDRYTEGSLKKNLEELDSIWADTFVDTSGAIVRDKRQMLEVIQKAPKLQSLTIADRKVQVYGGDAAVVTGQFTATAVQNGHPASESGRFTDVFVKQNGKWRCVAAHSSAITP